MTWYRMTIEQLVAELTKIHDSQDCFCHPDPHNYEQSVYCDRCEAGHAINKAREILEETHKTIQERCKPFRPINAKE